MTAIGPTSAPAAAPAGNHQRRPVGRIPGCRRPRLARILNSPEREVIQDKKVTARNPRSSNPSQVNASRPVRIQAPRLRVL